MSTEGKIKFGKKEFNYKFGMKQIRQFMQDHKLKNMQQYWQVFNGLDEQTPESIIQLGKVLKSAIKVCGDVNGLPKDNDDLIDGLFQSGSFQDVLDALTASMPKMNNATAPSGKS